MYMHVYRLEPYYYSSSKTCVYNTCILIISCIRTDGHHKLVRWGMVTHGAIDGYSRLVVFLRCSNNNTAETVYNLFLSAVQRFGLPSRM